MSFSARIFVFTSSFVLLFLLSFSSSHAASNLLVNPGFEEGTTDWVRYPSTTTFEATSSAVRSGSYAALLTKKSAKGYAYIYQEIQATPSATYKFSGWVRFSDPQVRFVRLRIDWRDDANKRVSLSEIRLNDRASDFQKMILTATAPVDSTRAKIEAYVYLDAPNPTTPVLFDDLRLELVEPLVISFSLPSAVTVGEPFDVPVVVKNADPSSKYYLKALIGEFSGGSFYRGYTYNPDQDKWLAWNGSWAQMPMLTTDSQGSAAFTLRSKVKDGLSAGDYYYLVRLRKVGSDNNLDSAVRPLTVNTVAAAASSSDSTGLMISFSVDEDLVSVDRSFSVQLSFIQAKPWHDYHVKIRLGLESSSLIKGRTHNSFNAPPEDWLADNKPWSKFPILYTDSVGSWDGTIGAKVAAGNPAGNYYLAVRLRDKETGQNYDSEVKLVDVIATDDEPVELAAAVKNDRGAVLGATTELPRTGASVWIPPFIWMGLIFLGSSLPGASVSENKALDFAAHKLIHLIEYAILFILLWWSWRRTFLRHAAVAAFLLTVLFAVSDEIHQLFVPGRDGKFIDVIIDAVAALLGFLAVRCQSWRR